MNAFCRACLLRKSQLVSLSDNRNDTPILDMLASVCGIHFNESHRFSQVICERCLAKLELAHAVAQEFRDQEMLRRSLWLADAWLVRLEEYQTMAREEPRSDRLLKGLTASIDQEKEEGTEMTVAAKTVVKEELIIEEDLNVLCDNYALYEEQDVDKEPCSPQVPITDAMLEVELDESDKPHESQDNQPDEEVPAMRQYWCNGCKIQLSNLNEYRNHLMKHEQIRQHNRTWDNEQKRTCAHCKREFPDVGTFQSHVAWHNRMGLLCCSSCGENQVTPGLLKVHICPMASIPGKMENPRLARHQYRCEECGKRFANRKFFEIHRERHETIRKGTFKCDICFKSLAGKIHLRKHMMAHKALPDCFKRCMECGKEFTSANAYNCHVYRHKKDRNGPFQCHKCEKKYSTQARLNNHTCHSMVSIWTSKEDIAQESICLEENSLTTVKEEPTEENIVELEAAGSSTTTEHISHQPLPVWKQNCEECGRKFVNANSYHCHMKRHRNVRIGKFRCVACGKCLPSRGQLMQHKCLARQGQQ